MAKKKSKKLNTAQLVVSIIIIALAVLTICTLFMPVFKNNSTILGNTTSTTVATGSDLITACFNSEIKSGMSTEVANLVIMKNGDSTGFVTTVFCWLYFITILVSAAVLVFAVLSMIGLKFTLINTILGGAMTLLGILALIFGFVVAGKFGSADLFVASSKTVASAVVWLMIVPMVNGCATIYKARA